MEEKQYFFRLEEIDNKINNNNFNEAEEDLQELYFIKPVRLKWFILKAKLIYKNIKNYNEIWDTLSNKGWALYNYDSVSNYLKLYSEINASYYDYSDSNRNRINAAILECSEEEKKECETIINGNNTRLEENENKFLSNVNSEEILDYLLEIQDCSLIFENKILYLLITFYLDKMNINDYGKMFNYYTTHRGWILNMPNVGYLKEMIESDNKETFVLVIDGNPKDYEVAAHIINKLNKQVFIINKPIEVELNGNVSMQDTVNISIENSEEYYENIILITPIKLIKDGEVIGDNIDYIIDYICKNYTKNDLVAVITSGKLFDELALRPFMKKRLERLSEFEADYREDNMAFGWVGNYLSYISRVYCFNVEEEIKKEPQYKFSIVIPARNSAYSLRYTLQTCLNQTYKGDYEIVVSDNSTNGNKDVYNLIKEINDPHIKYYKTPRDLHLPKSFEFAFLKAKGEFIFSIGSDDGVFPWTLEVLEKALDKYPNNNIFKWDRGFYAWPGFNSGQENELVIPGNYENGEINSKVVNGIDYFARILNNPRDMYCLPMLYINSGFRRSYLNILLDKTGRLWDGICQDIYMGVVTSIIEKHIIEINYPLSIAGMTNGSVGANSNKGVHNIQEANKKITENRKTNNIGGFSMSRVERLMPQLGSDISSLYNSILRCIARGILSDTYLNEVLNWKQMFVECYSIMDITDVYFDKNIHYMRYIAMKHGNEFLKWFDEKIYKHALTPRVINQGKKSKEKTYNEGNTKYGGMVLDASKYKVKNIYEASCLFQQITQL